MNVEFERNRINTSDPNYVYDKRVEFETQDLETNDWDE
jgi:hypothetical protein